MKSKTPTNAQMEQRDEIEARRIIANLARQREIEGDSVRLPMPKPHRVVEPSKGGGKTSGIRFDIPATRPYRPQTPSGARSFHFEHEPVVRSDRASILNNRNHGPGAAKDHARYIERRSAVADLARANARDHSPNIPEFTSDAVTNPAADLASGQSPDLRNDAGSTLEQRMNHDDYDNAATIRASEFGLEELPIRQPDTETAGDDEPQGPAQPHADLRLLPDGELVCDEWEAPQLLHGAEEIHLDDGLGSDFLRCPGKTDCPDKGAEPEYLAGVGGSEAARTDQYIIRPSAVAFQPDGTQALITNIDDDPIERGKFWHAIEQHERKSNGDNMTFSVSSYPGFWRQVAAQPNCPPELLAKITGDDADKTTTISIKNGKAVRRFLSKQPGWKQGDRDISRDGKFPLAKFSDGRGGRVQYRIVAELPADMPMEARFRVMKAFAHEFEKRGLPFIAVIHAPDEHNHDQNWHMHLAYYDRPCRKIDQDDIDSLSAKGFDTSQLKPGMWDFTCAVHKFNRPNRKSFPLRQNKVAEISREKGWPKYLRRKFAQCVNEELELIGSQMRFDPRKYEDMDIPAVPQEHLGPSEHAREVKGEIIEKGIRNEQKQWDFIMAKLKANYQRHIGAIDGELADLMQGLAQHPNAMHIEPLFRESLEKIADQRFDANVAEEKLERQASRARFIKERNLKMLEAHDAGISKMSPKAAQESRDLVKQAQAYLDQLELDHKRKREEIAKVRRWCGEKVLTLRAVAQQYREQVTEMQHQARVAQQRSVTAPAVQAERQSTAHQLSVMPRIPAKSQIFGPRSTPSQPPAVSSTQAGGNPNAPEWEPSVDEPLEAAKKFLKARGCRIYENSDGSLQPEMVFWEGAGLEPWLLKHPDVVTQLKKAWSRQKLFIDLFTDICVDTADIASAQRGADAMMQKIPADRQWEMKAWRNTGLIEEVLIPAVIKVGTGRALNAARTWNRAAVSSKERAAAAIEAEDWQRRWPNAIKPDLLMQLEQEAKAARLQRQAMQKAAADDATGDQGSLGTHRDPDDAQVKRERDERERRLRVLEEQRRRQQGLGL